LGSFPTPWTTVTLGVDIPVLMLGKTEAAPGFTTKTLPAAKAAISSGRGSILRKPSMESEATRQLCWGSKLSGLTVAHPHRLLWDCRANLHSVLLPPELPEARQPGRRTRPRARTWRAPSAPAAPHQPDPPCVAATSATARRTESPDGTGPAERARGRRTPPQTPLEPAQLAAPACFASSFYPPKWLTGGGTRLSHSVIWWRKYHHHMIEGNDVP
jgi:hypothetical protein